MFKSKKKKYPRRYSSYRKMKSTPQGLTIWQRSGIALIILVLVAIPVIFSGRLPGRAQPLLKDIFLAHFSVQDLTSAVSSLTNGKINSIETLSPNDDEEVAEAEDTIMALSEIPQLSLPVVGRIEEEATLESNSIHIVAIKGYPVVAVLAGKVTAIDGDEATGMVVEIDHGRGLRTVYSLLGALAVNVDDEVQKGDIIGRVGQFDDTAGVDFEIMLGEEYLEPQRFLQSK